jgi:CheY-like chemotaxis protein
LAALDWLASNPAVDVLLLDISMPDLCGEAVCRQLRANPAFDSLKIVAYTAHAGSDDSQRFLANGFNAVLIKPISSQRLKDVLAEVVGLDR